MSVELVTMSQSLPIVDVVDRKPFPFPVSETAAAVYGLGDGGPSVEVGPASGRSPFAAASPPPWHRLPPPKRSWYTTEPTAAVDASGCKLRTTLNHDSCLPASVSPGVVQPSYGYRTRGDDAALVASGLFLSQSSNGLVPPARNDSMLPAACYLSNAGKSHQTLYIGQPDCLKWETALWDYIHLYSPRKIA